MRNSDNLVEQVKTILCDIKELKTKQPVGSDQVEISNVVTNEIKVMPVLIGGAYRVRVNLRVMSQELPRGNALLTYCVPIIKDEFGGEKTDDLIVVMRQRPDPFSDSNLWELGINDYITPKPLPLLVSFKISAAAKVTYQIEEISYGQGI